MSITQSLCEKIVLQMALLISPAVKQPQLLCIAEALVSGIRPKATDFGELEEIKVPFSKDVSPILSR